MDKKIQSIMDLFENEMHDMDLQEAISNAVERLKEADCENAAIPYILKTIEKYPHLDWGTPGGFAHYMEEYINDDYFDLLLESYNRKPTVNTAFLLFRVSNNFDDKTVIIEAFEKSLKMINTNQLFEDVKEYIEWLK